MAGTGNTVKASRILKTILTFIVSVFVLCVIVFWISRLAPGDPLYSYYGDRVEKMSVAQKEQAMERLGLDEPVIIQFGKWLANAAHGEFGISFKYKQDVLTVIGERIGNTLLLGGLGFILIFILALMLGMYLARREGSLADRIICRLGTITGCIPEFWMSLLFIMLFSVALGWLPGSGAYSVGGGGFADRLVHLILPLSVQVIAHLWYFAYMVRNMLTGEMTRDYYLLARSKGLTEKQVLRRHCLRCIMPTYLTLMAISVPHILGGTYIIEMVFSYPGIGTLSYESAMYHDYNLLMVVCLITGAIVILCSITGRIISERIDPRTRSGEVMSAQGSVRLGGTSMRKKPLAASAVLLVIVLGCVFAEFIMNHDPTYMDLSNVSVAPCSEFYFGTDSMGRDIFSMIWYGGRISLAIGALATIISTALAILYGSLSGLAPDWLDNLMMRFAEILLSVPNLLMVIMLQAIIGEASVISISVVLGLTGWMSVAKVVRSEVRALRTSEYVIAARTMGAGKMYIIRRHLAPNFISSIMFMVVMNIRDAIVSESTLSFMGIGLPLEIISWGSMLSLAGRGMLTGAWWVVLIPGAFLVITLLCITEIGEYLRK